MSTATVSAAAGAAEAAPAKEDRPFTSAIPEPYQVLGLQLLPLSVGRYRRLARHGCAFVSGGASEATLVDLILGVLVCSMRCDEFDAFAVSPDFHREVNRWMEHVAPTPRLARLLAVFDRAERWQRLPRAARSAVRIASLPVRLLYGLWSESALGRRWRRKHTVDFAPRLQMFRQYVEEAQRTPRMYARESEAKTSTAHWADNLEMVLRSQLGWSAEEVDEQPLAKALSDWCQWAEANGHIDIVTEEEEQWADHNSERIAAALAELQKGGR